MRKFGLWLFHWLDIYEGGHLPGPFSCSRFGRHKHLPLGLIKWYP